MDRDVYQSAYPMFLSGGGEMGSRIRAHDWSRSPLGPAENWPAALQSLIRVALSANQAMYVAWGSSLVLLYNDAYAQILSERHPGALGKSLLDVWPENQDELGPLIRRLYACEPVQVDDVASLVQRCGRSEQAYYCFSYTPIPDDSGAMVGLLCTAIETTAHVLARRELSDQLAKQQRLLEQAPGFSAFLAGPEHVFAFTNSAYKRLFGERNYIGKSVRDAFPGLEGQGVYEQLACVYETGQRFRAEGVSVHLAQSGEMGPVDVVLDFIYEPVVDETGVIGVFVEGYDVTERQRAQEALRTSEKLFSTLAQTIPSHVWMAKPSGEIYWFNESCYQYYGVGHGELSDGKVSQYFHPDDRPILLEKWKAALTSGEKYEAEKRIRRADGAYRWHLARAVPVKDEEGRILLWIGTSTDIEDQKRIAADLSLLNEELGQRVEERTAEYDRVWRNSRDLLMVLGVDGIYRAVNPAWAKILGFEPEEVVGRSFLEFIWPEDTQLTREAHDQAILSRQLTDLEKRHKHKDGSYRWISWHTATEGDRVYGYGRDITTQKEQAAALRQSEERLHQAQKMEAVGQLTSGISHDFNNLLAGIIGALDLIQTRLAQGELEKLDVFASGAMQAAQRAASLVNRLLAFSRRQPIDPRIVDVAVELAGMEELIRRTIPHHAFELIIEEGLGPVRCDPSQLAASVLNLAINARDAMPESGRLLIEARSVHIPRLLGAPQTDVAAGDYVAISVTDTGTGMPAEVRERVFEPFFTTKPHGQGTGLGLSMVYGFARQSEGDVRIRSEEAKGTTITIYLPRY